MHIGMFEDAGGHGRYGAPTSDFPAFYQLECFPRVEPLGRHHQGTTDHDGPQESLNAADMEKRSGMKANIPRGAIELMRQPLADVEQLMQSSQQGTVRKYHRLSSTGCTGRKNNHRCIVF